MSVKPSVLGILIQNSRELASLTQAQKDANDRLFGANGQPGVLTYLKSIDEKQGEALDALKTLVVAHKADTDMKFAAIEAARKTQRAYVVGFAAAASGIGAGLAKVAAPFFALFRHHS